MNTTSPPHYLTTPERWSRTVGALGEITWRRLTALEYNLVGVGRTGALVATSLARTGASRLTLIDPDGVEAHNLDMDGVTEADMGRPKVEAIAGSLRSIQPNIHIKICSESVTSLAALSYIKESDALICCADNDGARWACGLLSVLYLKPLLDVGTGVFGGEGRGRKGTEGERGDGGGREQNPPSHHLTISPPHHPTIGADIRLALPGDACLACLGGVANPAQVDEVFRSRADEERFQAHRDWRRERAGSLRSLTQVAAGLALRLLEDFLAGRVERSVWLRLEYEEDGLPQLRAQHAQRTVPCLLCAATGGGDDGIAAVTRGMGPSD